MVDENLETVQHNTLLLEYHPEYHPESAICMMKPPPPSVANCPETCTLQIVAITYASCPIHTYHAPDSNPINCPPPLSLLDHRSPTGPVPRKHRVLSHSWLCSMQYCPFHSPSHSAMQHD